MSFDQDPNEQANISGADLAILVDELTSCRDKLAKENDASLKLMAEITAANERIRGLEAELNALNYSYQLDEELIGMIQKIITVLNNRPVPVALTNTKGERDEL